MTQLDPATRSHLASSVPPPGDADSGLIARELRRVATYLHLQQLVTGRSVVEAWSGPADPRGWQTLAARGARHITVVSVDDATPRSRPPEGKKDVARVVGDATRTGLGIASAEVFIALEVDPAMLADVVREARRVLVPDGVLVLGVASRDLPGASGGASYYDVVDACAPFSHTRMIGVAPFAGTTLVEYGLKNPEPILDGTLVERGERVEQYVAVAGPERRSDFGYGVVQVPVQSVVVGRTTVVEKAVERVVENVTAQAPENERLVGELEHADEQAGTLEARVAKAEQAQASAEQQERDVRRKLASLEGRALVGGVAGRVAVEGDEDIAKLKQRLADAESESWKQMKGRSEAEAMASALREDNLRKLTDARKVAQAELMRAMEEAAKKALSLRDDVDRVERQRKAALAELEASKTTHTLALAELQQERDLALAAARPASNVDTLRDELDGLRARVAELGLELQRRDAAVERAAAAAAHERTRSERLIVDQRHALVERNDARARAAEASALVAGIDADRERAKSALEFTEARAQKAEQEVKEKRERIRELKRELEDVERRAGHGVARGRALEQVRARVHALELAVLGEAGRLKHLEVQLRSA
ncbi:MAG: hypothetical protein ABI321_01605 [Polyangia bacterium]